MESIRKEGDWPGNGGEDDTGTLSLDEQIAGSFPKALEERNEPPDLRGRLYAGSGSKSKQTRLAPASPPRTAAFGMARSGGGVSGPSAVPAKRKGSDPDGMRSLSPVGGAAGIVRQRRRESGSRSPGPGLGTPRGGGQLMPKLGKTLPSAGATGLGQTASQGKKGGSGGNGAAGTGSGMLLSKTLTGQQQYKTEVFGKTGGRSQGHGHSTAIVADGEDTSYIKNTKMSPKMYSSSRKALPSENVTGSGSGFPLPTPPHALEPIEGVPGLKGSISGDALQQTPEAGSGGTFLESLSLTPHQLDELLHHEGHFLYLRQKPCMNASPYNLEVTTNFELNANKGEVNEYYTLSRVGITHFTNLKDADSDFTPLDSWEREYALFHLMQGIPFFDMYRRWKSFTVWKRAVKAHKFRDSGQALETKLFAFIPALRTAVFGIRNECVLVAGQKLFAVEAGTTITLEQLKEAQAGIKKKVADILSEFSSRVHALVRQSSDQVVEDFLAANNIVADHKMTFMERASLRSECCKLTRFLRLVDFIVVDTLRDLVLGSVTEAASLLSVRELQLVDPEKQNLSADQTPLFQVSATFSEDGVLVIIPPKEAFRQTVADVITASLEVTGIPERVLTSKELGAYVMAEGDDMDDVVNAEVSVEGMLENDERFHSVSSLIMKNLDTAFSQVEDYIQVFGPYKDTFFANHSYVNNIKEEFQDVELSAFRQEIDKYKHMTADFEGIPANGVVGILEVDSSDMRSRMLPSPLQCLFSLKELLPELMHDTASNLLDKLGSVIPVIAGACTSVENFVAKKKAVQEAQSEMEGYKEKRKRFFDMASVIAEYEWTLPDSEKAHMIMIEENMSALENGIQIAEGNEEEETKRFAEQITEEVPKLTKRIGGIREGLDNAMIASLDSEPQAVLRFLSRQAKELKKQSENADKLMEYQAILGQPVDEYETLDEVNADLSLKTRMWEGVKDWSSLTAKWLQTPFTEIDASELEVVVARYTKTCHQASKGLPGNPVAKKLKEEVESFAPVLPVVVDLRNDSLKERHWEQIHEMIGFAIRGQDGLTLGDLLDKKVTTFHEEITNIATSAVQEAVLEEMMGKVSDMWSACEFEVKPYKDSKDVFIMGDVSEVIVNLDDSLVTVNTVLGSRYVSGIKELVDSWREKLARIQETLDEWMACQRNWLYLESIFSSPDIVRQLPAAAKMFQAVDRSWKNIMKLTADDPLALKQGLVKGRKELFASHNEALDKIQKNLEEYLETKRAAFPRFYFLSNDELLEILSQAKDPQAVQPHLRKCFDNLVALDFGDDPGSIDILAMQSSEGEKVSLGRNLKARGYVEDWLSQVEARMKVSLTQAMKAGLLDYDTKDREEWVQAGHPGQVVATVAQMTWARGTEEALRADNPVEAMAEWFKVYVAELNKLIIKIRGNLTKLERSIIVALVTTDVHARDIIEELHHNEVDSVHNFTWVQQLRYYWDMEVDNCRIKHSDACIPYGYEYMGATSRLVITPLTDRCWLTLTGSYELKLGAAPAGPAGTGKTESSKDLAKAMGILCVVFNCSDQIDYKMMGKLFRGLAQGGYWVCLDEFNRIDIEVLSVIAQQLLVLREGRLMAKADINFMGVQIGLKDHHVIITMNPGYAGRTELPDNLAVCFRPVAMMVPNYALIAEIMLFAEGFGDAKTLSRKMCKLYILCSEQLSQQPHYDYGLRAVKSVLVMAGALKRAHPGVNEDLTLIRALVDSNVPKFLADDLPLFAAIVKDLFPGLEVPPNDYGEFSVALTEVLQEKGLQEVPGFTKKIIQLFDIFNIRFGATLVGPTGSGKSTCYRVLADIMSGLRRQGSDNPQFQVVRCEILNPKCITMGELYGEFNELTQEWHDGLASTIMRRATLDTTDDKKWTVFDGPIDALWIENMNTVLDDNMTLCLANGERIKLKVEMKMLFEVMDLAVASPATVSRIGVVYMTPTDLGWMPYVQSWIPTLPESFGEPLKAHLLTLFEKSVQQGVDFQRKNCKEPVECVDIQLITSLSFIFQGLVIETASLWPTLEEAVAKGLSEKLFIFSYVWSICGSVDASGWDAMDGFVRDMIDNAGLTVRLPPTGMVYDYFVEVTTKEFAPWSGIVAPFVYNPLDSYFQMVVPTVDTTRFSYLFSRLISQNKPAFVTGMTGTGKTVMVQALLSQLEPLPEDGGLGLLPVTINFSAQTSSRVTQAMMEGKLEKKRKNLLGAPAGRKVVFFVDDVNMPIVEEYGAQAPVELVRQFLDFKGFYDRDKLFWKDISDTLIFTGAAPPGGGRSKVTPRFVRHFNVFCVPPGSSAAMSLIFNSMLGGFLSTKFDPEIKKKAEGIVEATIEVYNRISAELLPTPARFHYTFNLRDISKVFQGILMVTAPKCTTPETMVKLWIHECQRVFYDRLISLEDQAWLEDLMCELLTRNLKMTWSREDVFRADDPIIFCDMLKPGAEKRLYEESKDINKLQHILNESLEEYNVSFANQMNIVFFTDAIIHVSRISRILRQPRGNAMLVGVGGSGKQSLTRVASFVAGYECIQIEINRGYGLVEFREDIKTMMIKAGVEGKSTTFLFTDTQIVVETMLEDINNLLNSGEVPNLFPQDEQDKIAGDMIPVLKEAGIPETRDNCLAYFVLRVRDRLHVVLCMSPVGDALRIRCRNFPSLINCVTIDWFFPWPASALTSVANRFIANLPLPSEEITAGLVRLCGVVHQSIEEYADRFYSELRRHVYITPKSYLDLINSYIANLEVLQSAIQEKAGQMEVGVAKLTETNAMVEGLKEELTKLEPVLEEKSKAAEELLKQVEIDKAEAAIVKERVSKEEADVGVQAAEVRAVQADAQADLDVALPALEKALKALDSLTKNDITEVKSFAKPPPAVQLVMEAVCILFEVKPDWDNSKKLLGDSAFMDKLKNYDKDNIKEAVLKKLKTYTTNAGMQIEVVQKVSKAASGLCMFCHAMDVYSLVAKNVAPKKARLEEMNEILSKANAVLAEKQAELKAVNDKVAELERQCAETVEEKRSLTEEADVTAKRLIRAEKLTSGLASEGVRWEATLKELAEQKTNMIGDAFMACGCVSYYGPFTGVYRDELVARWQKEVQEMQVPCSENYNLMQTLGNAVEVQQWQNFSLPTDRVSTDSAILVTKGSRWPLMIDPQGQANKWIKKLHEEDDVSVTTMNDINLLRTLENCIRIGKPLLIEDITEQIEPALEPVLQKATFKQGNRLLIRIGDSDVDYNKDFKMYMTTKMPNPHYLPEVCIKVNVINFTVTMDGLEDQLLGQVVAKERPDIEKRKRQLLMRMADDKKQLQDLEAKILELLSKSSGNILDDEVLINTLADSKTTSSIIKERVEESEKTEIEINLARNEYRPVATRGSIIYFVIADLSAIDPMYQYSLQYYQALLDRCIDKCEKHEVLSKRLELLTDFSTVTIFENICRGLFEKDKLLFSSLICFQILKHRGEVAPPEWNLFLRGSGPVDRQKMPPNPNPKRLSEQQWDLLFAAEERIVTVSPSAQEDKEGEGTEPNDAPPASTEPEYPLSGLCESIANDWEAWASWADSSSPDQSPLPGGMDDRVAGFHRMLLIKAFREDYLLASIGEFVANSMGRRFAESPAATMDDIYVDMDNKTPCIFILSTGADPTNMLLRFAKKMDYADRMSLVSLGQGQGPYAAELVKKGSASGDWVLLQNCMLAKSWMPELEKIVFGLAANAENNNADFRLYLTSKPASYFPVSILQNGVKMTNEPPKGVKANVTRAWGNLLKEEDWEGCSKPLEFKKLLIGLLFFHANIQERRKFGPLGWNIRYAFDESDLETSIAVLRRFLEEQEVVPWDALRFVTGHINYGGRVTDDWDRRCLMSILRIYANEAILSEEGGGYKFSGSGIYYSPPAGSYQAISDYFEHLPPVDDPEIFGMHQNANVTFNTTESLTLMSTLLSLQPRESSTGGGMSSDDTVTELADNLAEQIPALLLMEDAGPTTFIMQSNGLLTSLAIVLTQEMVKFNRLLQKMTSSIADLKKAIKGLIVMSSDLDMMYTSFLNNQVPAIWTQVSFASLKTLASWVKDLLFRVVFMRGWLENGQPACFPLPVFFFPQGFMTGTLQTFARKYEVAIDTLNFRYNVLETVAEEIQEGPDDGVYCHGLWLEGARWDMKDWMLRVSDHGEMYSALPVIHFIPATGHVTSPKEYACPVYKTAERKGVLSTTGMSTNFVVAVELPTDVNPDIWTLYGVAALCNLSD